MTSIPLKKKTFAQGPKCGFNCAPGSNRAMDAPDLGRNEHAAD